MIYTNSCISKGDYLIACGHVVLAEKAEGHKSSSHFIGKIKWGHIVNQVRGELGHWRYSTFEDHIEILTKERSIGLHKTGYLLVSKHLQNFQTQPGIQHLLSLHLQY